MLLLLLLLLFVIIIVVIIVIIIIIFRRLRDCCVKAEGARLPAHGCRWRSATASISAMAPAAYLETRQHSYANAEMEPIFDETATELCTFLVHLHTENAFDLCLI